MTAKATGTERQVTPVQIRLGERSAHQDAVLPTIGSKTRDNPFPVEPNAEFIPHESRQFGLPVSQRTPQCANSKTRRPEKKQNEKYRRGTTQQPFTPGIPPDLRRRALIVIYMSQSSSSPASNMSPPIMVCVERKLVQ